MIKHGKRYLVRLVKELRFIAPLLLGLILVANFLAGKDAFSNAKEDVLMRQNIEAANFVTKKLLDNNQFTEVKKISGEKVIISEEKEPIIMQNNITTWQGVINNLPNYRDANIKLAILNWKLYRVFDAKRYVEAAIAIDPNNELARKLMVLVR